jgi:hypothetical protein
MNCRSEAQKVAGITAKQRLGLSLGSVKGTNHRTGYKHREESKKKTSESHKRFWSANPDKLAARGAKTRGDKHYRWKGGITKLNKSIRQMTEYRRWAERVVSRDNACKECGQETDLEAHHAKPLAIMICENGITTREQARACNELWDISNGLTLCEQCHCRQHKRAYTPTGNGRRRKPRKQRRSMAGEMNPNYKGGKIQRTCVVCHQPYFIKQAEVLKRKTCSRKCAHENLRKPLHTNAA